VTDTLTHHAQHQLEQPVIGAEANRRSGHHVADAWTVLACDQRASVLGEHIGAREDAEELVAVHDGQAVHVRGRHQRSRDAHIVVGVNGLHRSVHHLAHTLSQMTVDERCTARRE
jgi:hypothetical protein